MVKGLTHMKNLLAQLNRLMSDRSGASAIEYGLIAGLICIGLIGGITSIGTATNDSFTSVSAGFKD